MVLEKKKKGEYNLNFMYNISLINAAIFNKNLNHILLPFFFSYPINFIGKKNKNTFFYNFLSRSHNLFYFFYRNALFLSIDPGLKDRK